MTSCLYAASIPLSIKEKTMVDIYATSKQLWKINQLAYDYAVLVDQLKKKGELKLITQVPFPLNKKAADTMIKTLIAANEKLVEMIEMQKENEDLEQKIKELEEETNNA